MGRGSENLPLARASRLARPALMRRVPRLADYTGGRLSFGNERAAPLAFPPVVAARQRGGDRCRAYRAFGAASWRTSTLSPSGRRTLPMVSICERCSLSVVLISRKRTVPSRTAVMSGQPAR